MQTYLMEKVKKGKQHLLLSLRQTKINEDKRNIQSLLDN